MALFLHLNFIFMLSVKRLCLFILLTCATSFTAYAQSFTISGFISDRESGEMLVGAYVFCPQTGSGTVTNNCGYYAISIPYGTKNILYMNEGYFAWIDTTRISGNKQVDIQLLQMEEGDEQTNPFITVKIDEDSEEEDNGESTEQQEPDSTYTPRISIKNSKEVENLIQYVIERNFKVIDRIENAYLEVPGITISKMPSLLGEIDVGRSIKHLPGIMPGTELTNGMYVRGGGQDQNLVLIDGIPIYNMNHAFGFYSIFNSESINSINVTKGGFSARNGGRLSAITDVTMKEGNSKTVHGIFLNSLVAFTLNLDGPLSRDGRTTFSIAARRSHWDLFIFRPISTPESKFNYAFYDINAKVCHRIDSKSKLVFSVHTNRDRLFTEDNFEDTINNQVRQMSDKFDMRWGNFAGGVKLNKVINEKLFASYSLMFSQYRSSIGLRFKSAFDSSGVSDVSEAELKYINYIRDYSGNANFDYHADKTHTLHFGGQFSIKSFLPGTLKSSFIRNGLSTSDTFFGLSKAQQTQEIAVYMEDEMKLNSNTILSVGGRLVNYTYKTKNFVFLEPRLSFNRKIKNNFALKGSYGIMNQSLHLLADNINSSVLALNFDRWVPATDLAKPQRSHQFTLGLSKPLKNSWEFSAEAYYKLFDRVLEIKEGVDINGGLLTSNEWESKVLTGTGKNYGIETFLHKRRGDFTGWLSYTWSVAKRNTPGVNRGEDYYFQFDRRHYINLVAQTLIDEEYSASINIVYSTGNVQSVPIGKYLDINGNIVYDYTEKNNYRLPYTLRVDVGLTKVKEESVGSESGYRFSVYNVFARHNPAYVYIDNSGAKPTAYQFGFLQFLPGVTYYIKF